MSVTDREELARILQTLSESRRDETAWRVLFQRLWPYVFAVNYRLLKGGRSAAEDASQEVFIRLAQYAQFPRLQEPEAFLSYVRAVCKNVARTAASRSRNTNDTKDLEIDVDGCPDSSASVERALVVSEQLTHLMAKLERKDEMFLMLVAEGLSLQEIAERTGYTYSNVGVRLHRLRKWLIEHSNETEDCESHPLNLKNPKQK